MAEMLELSDCKFRTVIYMLWALTTKVDSMQEQTSNVSREIEMIKKSQREMLEIKNIKIKMKHTFDGFIRRLDPGEERT